MPLQCLVLQLAENAVHSAVTEGATVLDSLMESGVCAVFLEAFGFFINSILCFTTPLHSTPFLFNIFSKQLVVRCCFLLLRSASSLRLAQLSLTASDSQQIVSCFFNSGHRRDSNEFHKTVMIFHLTSSCIVFNGSQLTVVLSISSGPNLLSTRRRKSGDCAPKAIFSVFQRIRFFCLWRYCNGLSFGVYGWQSLYRRQTPLHSVLFIIRPSPLINITCRNPSFHLTSPLPLLRFSDPFFQLSLFYVFCNNFSHFSIPCCVHS